MPTRVEEICKRIHILFAKGETYQNSPDLVILSKTEMFQLLEELNEAMYEVLDQYEASTRAKEKAKIETEREAAEIISKARLGAEDVQAVSFAYTDTMLDELNKMIEKTKQQIREEYLEFLAAMDEKQESLKDDRTKIQDQLAELHDSDSYMSLLNDIRENRSKDISDTDSGSDASDDPKDASSPKKEKSDDKPSEDEFPAPPKAPEPVIRVNKPGENSGVTFTTRRSHNKKNKTSAPSRQKTATVSESDYENMSPEELEALEASTPAYGYGYSADDFNLDAEYEQFKQENENSSEGNNSSKKSGFKLFGKKKNY